MVVEGKRSAPAQSYEWDSSGEDGEVAWIAAKLKGRRRLEVATVEKWIMPDF